MDSGTDKRLREMLPRSGTVLPGTVWFPLCLPSSPAPFLPGPEPGNFPHFHPPMLFSSLKSPSRPHPPECSARAHGRLLYLGTTTFPSPPHLHHQDLGALYSPTRRAPPYTSPRMRPIGPSSRRPGTLPGLCAWGRLCAHSLGGGHGRLWRSWSKVLLSQPQFPGLRMGSKVKHHRHHPCHTGACHPC